MRSKNNLQGVRSIVRQICSRIDRLIRSHKTVVIGFVAVLLIIAFAVKSIYSVPSCQKQTSIRIIDESGGKTLPVRSINTSEESPFKNYVNTISKYAFTKIDELGQCKGDLNSDPEVEMFFVYRPLISYGIVPFEFTSTKSNDTRYLDSPWVKLAISRSPKLIVRAAFIWNERQFLLDRAVLSDAHTASTKPPVPIDRDIFSQFEQDYIGIELNSLSKESKAAAQENLLRSPPDIMWLFRHSPLLDWAGLVTDRALGNTIKQGMEQNIELTKALLNHRFASPQTEQRYQSVLDLKDVFNIDKYQIN